MKQSENRSGVRKFDRKAASNVVGAMLIFSMLVMMAGVIQTDIVPSERFNKELQKDNQISNSFEKLSSEVLSASSSGEEGSVSIPMGVKYNRKPIMFGLLPRIQPPSPAASLKMRQYQDQVKLYNVSGIGASQNFWHGDSENICKTPNHCYNSSHLSYSIDYNEIPDNNTPVRKMSYGVYYEKYPELDRYIVKNDYSLVNGNNINLMMLAGNFSMTKMDPQDIAVTKVSAPSNPISIQNGSGPIKIGLPTDLPIEVWKKQILDDELSPDGSVTDISKNNGYLNITLKNSSYSLSMSKVRVAPREGLVSSSIDTGTDSEDGRYIAWNGNDKTNIETGKVNVLTAEVRDRYNNPVSGVTVEAKAVDKDGFCIGDFSSGTSVCNNGGTSYSQPGRGITDNEGKVRFYYELGDSVNSTDITFSMKIVE